MAEISSYVQYLPPVLWTPDYDPSLFLGRVLRVFEKILTGIPIQTQALRVSAPFIQAAGNHIQLTNAADAGLFRSGDTITIEGTTEQVQIDQLIGGDIFLLTNLAGTYAGGAVRIADLEPGQTTFRVSSTHNLGAGFVIKISQGPASETATIQKIEGEFIILRSGLINTYPMSDKNVSVMIQDGLPIAHDGHEHVPLAETIDQLFQLFDPWQARTDFLPWLASWVALTLEENWSEYQQRKLISEMVSIYQQRGLKKGLYTYLDIYAVTAAKPRIAIDDGEAVLRATLLEDGTGSLHAVAQSNTISLSAGATISVLLHPTAIAIDGKNDYIVADQGAIALTVPRPPALWRISNTGHVDYVTGPPIPTPAPIYDGSPLESPTAVVVDALDRYAVVDFGTVLSGSSIDSAIFRFAPPVYSITTVIDQSTTPPLPAVRPVDMILDGFGNFIILDRGFHALGDPPSGAAVPKIVVVSEGPLATSQHPLSTVVEPTAIVMDPAGRLIVADAKNQYQANPADLILVDPSANWSETSLLGGIAAGQNPLIYPIGLAFESSEILIVCDTGVRWGWSGGPSNRSMAELAALYRVDLSQTPPVITRIQHENRLVSPTKMVKDQNGHFIITDRGEVLRSIPNRDWRAGSSEFGVVVLFSQQYPTTSQERNKIRRGIADVVNKQKPGHCAWWMDF